MKRYDSLNGLRTIACIGIVLLHIQLNMNISIDNSITRLIYSNLTQFTFLFMIISSFGMCCGYYDKIKKQQISFDSFYSKRIKKIIPFFTFLVIIDIVVEHNWNAVIEGMCDLTLLFGFIPQKLEVIGVAWYLGLVFVFYIMFPFFVFLFWNRKRAVAFSVCSLIMNFIAIGYFGLGKTNMFYSLVYFCLGGLIFLYKDTIQRFVSKNKYIILLLGVLLTVVYFLVPENKFIFTVKTLLVFGIWMCIAVGTEKNVILNNRFTGFISKVSLEIYLSHMLCFRAIEKINLAKYIGNIHIQYVVCVVWSFIMSIGLAVVFGWVCKYLNTKIEFLRSKNEEKSSN